MHEGDVVRMVGLLGFKLDASPLLPVPHGLQRYTTSPFHCRVEAQAVTHSTVVEAQAVTHSTVVGAQAVTHSTVVEAQVVTHSTVVEAQAVTHSTLVGAQAVTHSTVVTCTFPHAAR